MQTTCIFLVYSQTEKKVSIGLKHPYATEIGSTLFFFFFVALSYIAMLIQSPCEAISASFNNCTHILFLKQDFI